ncbi:MAG: hypothetical protein AAB225_18005, partial [Acidobacteriota bacterium]
LDVKLEGRKITLVPKIAVERKSPNRVLLDALRAVQRDARQKGLDRLTMRQINQLIAEVRGERPARRPRQ